MLVQKVLLPTDLFRPIEVFSSSKLQTLSLSSHKPSPNTQALHVRCVTVAAPFLIIVFSSYCNKIPNKSRSEFGLQVKGWAIMVRKPWRQEHEAPGHVACTVRKQSAMNAGAQLALSFLLSSGAQSMEWCCPFSVVGLLISTRYLTGLFTVLSPR